MFAGSTLLFIDSLDDFKFSRFLGDNLDGLLAVNINVSGFAKFFTGFLRMVGSIGARTD